jgi:hypothetical protein
LPLEPLARIENFITYFSIKSIRYTDANL